MKKILYLISLPLLGIIIFYVFGTNNANFEESIKQERKARLHFLTNSSASPVQDKVNFTHPGFFNISKKYRTTGKITHNPKTQQIALEMSGGTVETYIHYGVIKFNLLDSPHELILFQNIENTSEFLLPFADLSNGKSTYGAGRHLPIKFSGGENIVLDFNLAENPFCAYNPSYTCPLPPKQNQLNIAIEAGEKISTH